MDTDRPHFVNTLIDRSGRPFRMFMNRSSARFWAGIDRADVIDTATGEVLAHYDRRTGKVA